MKRASIFLTIFILFFALVSNGHTDCRGCCTGHGGVICIDGKTMCRDGSPLSEECVAKGCDKCGDRTTRDEIPDEKVTVTSNVTGNTTIDSFNEAKKTLLREVYRDHRKTFYCGCSFTDRKQIIHDNGYVPKKKWKRASRLEWEHVVPAHAFGQSFVEWREGHPDCINKDGTPFKGRNCAQKVNMQFRYMQADIYNLVPAIGEINGLRSNYSFAMIPGERRDFGACDMEIEDRKAEPPPDKYGDIARTYFYMDAAYPGHGIISKKNRKLFQAWDRMDPVDEWECERCQRIEQIQGNENPFVKAPCQEAGMW